MYKVGQTQVFAYGKDTHSLRLKSELFDLRSRYAHTACGILPNEQQETKNSIKRNKHSKSKSEWQYWILSQKSDRADCRDRRPRLSAKLQKTKAPDL